MQAELPYLKTISSRTHKDTNQIWRTKMMKKLDSQTGLTRIPRTMEMLLTEISLENRRNREEERNMEASQENNCTNKMTIKTTTKATCTTMVATWTKVTTTTMGTICTTGLRMNSNLTVASDISSSNINISNHRRWIDLGRVTPSMVNRITMMDLRQLVRISVVTINSTKTIRINNKWTERVTISDQIS